MKRFQIGLRDLAAASILLSIIGLSMQGCSKPLVVGGQITRVPSGFMFDANAYAGRLIFHRREKVDQRGYFYLTHDDENCSIMITEFTGPTGPDEARAAFEYHRSTYPSEEYGPLESLRIDGRDAWGWESVQRYKGQIAAREYHAIVSYPNRNATYTVEFYAGVDRFMDPDLIRKTVESFTVKDKREVSYAQIGVVLALVFAFALGFRKVRS